MELFDEEFIQNLPDDPMLCGYQICGHFFEWHEFTQGTRGIESFLETYALLKTISDEHGLNWKIGENSQGESDLTEDSMLRAFNVLYGQFRQYYESHEKEKLLDKFANKYRTLKRGAFVYEFSEGDLKRVRELISLLRDEISESELFEDSHKRRLLLRLEKLQSEIHKKQSDLDRLWGLVGDAGVAIGKFGKDAKPFVDLIKEITNIVWRTQAKAEELSSDAPPPVLGNDDKKSNNGN